ncbi:MAG: serine/threonine-protein kinase [Thermoanaerobaculia bacterium]
MSLTPGTRLGPYEIVLPLGAGGMGEVYRARDTRLERTVAIKVLSSRLAANADALARFEREARTISQLSHPHICAVHDVGREGETEYLVMEYLEGETLAERLLKGPLPLEQTLRFGVQIADALDKAHRQGIVHGDLKPGNVRLTKSGVKLLDFGLAKAIAPAGPQSSGTELPTQQALTQEGTILGTFEYMAPEQVEGTEADARTDIFAFGAVLYEMATGRIYRADRRLMAAPVSAGESFEAGSPAPLFDTKSGAHFFAVESLRAAVPDPDSLRKERSEYDRPAGLGRGASEKVTLASGARLGPYGGDSAELSSLPGMRRKGAASARVL